MERLKKFYRDWKIGREFKRLVKDPHYASLKKRARDYLGQLPVREKRTDDAP